RANVVRPPRDWLGPREELVPFGPRAASRVPDESSPTDDAAPSAEDFWGERSAAIHGALQAPADWAAADPDPTDRGPVGARAIRLRGFDRRAAAAATAGLAAVAVMVVAVVSIFGAGPAP